MRHNIFASMLSLAVVTGAVPLQEQTYNIAADHLEPASSTHLA